MATIGIGLGFRGSGSEVRRRGSLFFVCFLLIWGGGGEA